MQVRRDLQPLNAPSNFSAAAKRRIVQHAELDLMVVTVSKIRHSERMFTMTEDAHPSVQHDPLLLATVRFEEPVIGLSGHTFFANWEAAEPWQQILRAGGRVDEVIGGEEAGFCVDEDHRRAHRP